MDDDTTARSVQTRMTEAQLSEIKAAADERGLSVAAFVRSAALAAARRHTDPRL